jgi:hypothetical protein
MKTELASIAIRTRVRRRGKKLGLATHSRWGFSTLDCKVEAHPAAPIALTLTLRCRVHCIRAVCGMAAKGQMRPQDMDMVAAMTGLPADGLGFGVWINTPMSGVRCPARARCAVLALIRPPPHGTGHILYFGGFGARGCILFLAPPPPPPVGFMTPRGARYMFG